MADQKMKGRRRLPLMILVFVFHVLSSMGVHALPSTAIYSVSGNFYQHGGYSVELFIGYPAKLFELHIDSGSTLSWVQCRWRDLSIGRTMPPDKLYRPVENNYLPCTSPILSEAICEQGNNICFCPLLYHDRAFSHVVAVSDYNSVLLVDKTFHIPHLAFGCAYHIGSYTPGPYGIYDGTLGLGKGKEGILSQFTAMGLTRNVTGHCFKRQGGRGYLFFGDEPAVRINDMTWTPMAYYHSRFYIAGPAELFCNGLFTGINNLHVTFDSGSTLTYLSSKAYELVYSWIWYGAISTQVLQIVKEDGYPICWNRINGIPIQAVQHVSQYFGTFSLKFPGQVYAYLHFQPEDYLILTEQGNVCLGIEKKNQEDDQWIIGAVSMQDILIVYDNERQRIGWVDSEDCPLRKWLRD